MLILCFSVVFISKAQFLKQPISVSSPDESEQYNRLFSIGNDFLFLKKGKSSEITTKRFDLVKFDSQLKEKWEEPINMTQFENILNVSLSSKKLRLITVEHNLDSMTTAVWMKEVETISGETTSKKQLLKYQVGDWINSYGKAKVTQTFESAVASKQNANDVTPLEYRFEVDYSLDSSHVIIYQYDNSQSRLVIRGGLYDSNFKLIKNIRFEVDEAHITYGLKVDNGGEVYLLKISDNGKIAVVNYNLKTGERKYLSLPEESSSKVNPRLHIHTKHEVYIVYCNVKHDHLTGVSLATLNFDNETVDDTHFYKLDAEFLTLLNTHIRNGDKYYELAEIEEVNDQLVVLLEQHQIEGLDIHYHPNDVEKLAHWESGNATITTGNMLVLVFDKQLDPQGQFTIKKNQKGVVSDGMNTLSHRVFREDNGLRFVYSNSKKGKLNNELHSSVLDLEKFTFSDVIVSTHGRKKVPVITSVTYSPLGSIVFQTRKGIFGGKNYLSIWNFNSH